MSLCLSPRAFVRTYQRTTSGTTTDLTYRGLSEDAAKTVAGTTTTTYAFTAGGSPLGQKVGTTASYYLRDPHGDSVGVVSTTAANQGTTAFDPWGKPLATSGTQPLYGYQGSPTDPVTKLVDMGTRMYAPSLGRFTTRDILLGDPGHPISLNQFVYGADSPVTMTDPTGMGPRCETCEYTENKGQTEYVSCKRSGGSSCNSAWANAPAIHPAPPAPMPPASDLYRLLTRGVTADVRETAMWDLGYYYGDQGRDIVYEHLAAQQDAEQADITWQLYYNSDAGWQALQGFTTAMCAVPWYGCAVAEGGSLLLQEGVAFSEANRGPGFNGRQFARDTAFNGGLALATSALGSAKLEIGMQLARTIGAFDLNYGCTIYSPCSGPGAPDLFPGREWARK